MPSPLVRLVTVAILVAGVTIAGCASEPAPAPITPKDHAAAWQLWKDKRVKWLTTPNRAASFTGLRWLRQGATTIGSDSSNDVRLPGRNVPARVGTLIREGAKVRFEPAVGAASAIIIDSTPATARLLRSDGDSGGASTVTAGSAGFRIVKRLDSLGVRTWDGDKVSPEVIARTFTPFEHFPLQPEWRLAGRFEPLAKPESLGVPTVNGVAELYINIGKVKARVGGTPVALTAFAGNIPTDLFLSFSDETSGEETYGFRFIHAALDTATKVVTLDFNFAYNPECAFSAFTTCPLPPEGNRIGVRIPAGEKIIRHLDDTTHALTANGSTK